MKNRFAFFALPLFTLLLATCWIVLGRSTGGGSIPADSRNAQPAALRSDEADGLRNVQESDRRASPASRSSSSAIVGRTVDAVSKAPIAAIVRIGSRQIWSDPRDGTFVLRKDAIGVSPAWIEFTAAHYRSRSIPAPDGPDVGVVELSPAASCLVTVVGANGSTVDGAIVTAHLVPNRLPEKEVDLTTTTTGPQGTVEIALRGSQILQATKGDLTSPTQLVSSIDRRVTLRLDVPLAGKLLLLDESTGKSLSRIQLAFTPVRPSTSPTLTRLTGLDGIVEKPLPVGRYLVRSTAPEVLLVMEPDPSPFRSTRVSESVAVSLEDGAITTIRGRHLSRSRPIHVISAASGAPLEQIALRVRYHYSETGTWQYSEVRTLAPAHGGKVWIPDRILEILSHEEPWWLSVWSPGHLRREVDFSELPPSVPSPVTIALEPFHHWELVFRRSDGSVYRGSVKIVEQSPDPGVQIPFFEGRVPAEGRIPGTEWKGGALVVELGGGGEQRVSADTILNSRLIELEAPATGSIVVAGVPSSVGAEIVACAATTGAVFAGWRAGDAWIFDDLLPGDYSITPRARRGDAVLDRGFARTPPFATRVEVLEGSETRVDWDPGWAADRTLEGKLRARGVDERDLFVLSVTPGLPVRADRIVRYPVQGDGHYRIEGGTTNDLLLAGTVDREGRLVPLAVGEPGHELLVESASLAVHSNRSPNARVHVAFELPPSPVGVFPKRLVYSDVGSVRIRHLPLEVDAVRVVVQTEEGEWIERVPVVLNAGQELQLHLGD